MWLTSISDHRFFYRFLLCNIHLFGHMWFTVAQWKKKIYITKSPPLVPFSFIHFCIGKLCWNFFLLLMHIWFMMQNDLADHVELVDGSSHSHIEYLIWINNSMWLSFNCLFALSPRFNASQNCADPNTDGTYWSGAGLNFWWICVLCAIELDTGNSYEWKLVMELHWSDSPTFLMIMNDF